LTQELSQLSLLDERDDRFGFRDLAGVHVSRKSSAPLIGLANVRLHRSVLRDIQVEHLGGRTNKYGQFVFAVDEARDDPDELFERAQAADQMGDMAKAERFQACAASGLSGARDEFDPAAIVQNLKTLVLRTIDQPPLRGGTQRPFARSGLVGGWNTRVFFSHTEAPRLVRNAGLHRIRCPETQLNRIRPHASLGYKPPAPEVYVPALAAWQAALRRTAAPATLAPKPTLN
jgi:hypothetical protein